MKLPKPAGIEDIIRWREERMAECEQHLEELKAADLRHPEHIKLKEYLRERIEKELQDHKETLEYLKQFIRK